MLKGGNFRNPNPKSADPSPLPIAATALVATDHRHQLIAVCHRARNITDCCWEAVAIRPQPLLASRVWQTSPDRPPILDQSAVLSLMIGRAPHRSVVHLLPMAFTLFFVVLTYFMSGENFGEEPYTQSIYRWKC